MPPDGRGPAARGPVATGGRVVPAEWIDYIGHMMDAYYFVAFTEATEAFLDHVGLGEAYRAASGCGMYTVESHLVFAGSARAGDELRYASLLLGADSKRLHVFHQMTLAPRPGQTGPGGEVATCELMFLHVDIATEKVVPLPPDRLAVITDLALAHAATPAPGNSGRRIGMPARREP